MCQLGNESDRSDLGGDSSDTEEDTSTDELCHRVRETADDRTGQHEEDADHDSDFASISISDDGKNGGERDLWQIVRGGNETKLSACGLFLDRSAPEHERQ